MPKSLKLYIAGVVALGAIALAAATLVFPADPQIALEYGPLNDQPSSTSIFLGLVFWTLLALLGSALPVKLPRGTQHAVAIAPIMGAIFLGGPMAAGWVAAIGTTEVRELRGRIPWYATLANHAGLVLPAILAGSLLHLERTVVSGQFAEFLTSMIAAGVFLLTNLLLASMLLALRTGQRVSDIILGDIRSIGVSWVALAPTAWLMAIIYMAQWWATALFIVPMYTIKLGFQKFVEMLDLFTQTIGALAEAVDKRDPFTARHSQRVKEISVDIGHVMRVSDSELEALEWGGLLHDVGKIGVPDNVLLKADRLTREERMIMNSHPVLGAQIIAPVARLAAELPIIRHHHEWFNGSGYPDRLIGDEIPKLARILHVADAFEAMTAARPYRMTPLTHEQALAELRKFAGIQFDPVVVDAFVRTHHVDGVPDAGRQGEPRHIPMLAQAAERMTATRVDEAVGTGPAGT